MTRTVFNPDALESPIAALDDLPRTLWLQGIVNSMGPLPSRLRGLVSLRQFLVSGSLPRVDEIHWPVGPAASAFIACLGKLRLAEYCRYSEQLTDQVIQSLLWHTDRIVDYRDVMTEPDAVKTAAEAFYADWNARAEQMEQLLYVFDDIGAAINFDRWDASRGRLRSEGWQELLRIRKLLEQLTPLRDVIRKLGRARQTEETDETRRPVTQIMEQVRRPVPRTREMRVPDMPAETRGIKRSGNIARMLPSETLLLTHRRLKLVWYARHIERGLLTYDDDDHSRETVMVEDDLWQKNRHPLPDCRLEMGPLIVCVDTSGSMCGAKEQVAKATVLEAMRVAQAQKRSCHLYAFGGPEEVIERELRLDEAGLDGLIGFLTQTFHGGTDIAEPIERAIAKVHEASWQFADLLIATDGEFGVTRETEASIQAACETLGLRVQGILIGDRETIGMRRICSDIYWLKDWRAFGEGGDCPIHDKSLTAIYFPQALT